MKRNRIGFILLLLLSAMIIGTFSSCNSSQKPKPSISPDAAVSVNASPTKKTETENPENGYQNSETEERLIKALNSTSKEERWNASANLGVIRSQKAVPHLIKALEDPNEQVRLLAAWSLGRMKEKRGVVPLMKAFSKSGHDETVFLIWALGETGDKRAAPLLEKKLFEIRETGTRTAIINSLAKIGAESSIPVLIKCLKDKNEDVRSASALALGGFKSDLSVPGLCSALDDEEEIVVIHAMISLDRLSPDNLESIIAPLLKHREESVRRQAELTLRNINTPNGQKSLRITSDLKRKDADLSKKMRKPNLKIPDISYLNPEDSANVAVLPIKLGIKVDVKETAADLNSPSPDVRSEAAWQLGNSFKKEAVPYLIKALKDKNSDVRWSAAKALGKLDDRRAVPPLIEAMEDSDKDVREDVIEALARLGDKRGIKPITANYFKEKHAYIRTEDVIALGYLGRDNPEAVRPVLEKALQDPSPMVREKSAKALGRTKSSKSLTLLKSKLTDPNADVRKSAQLAIDVIENRKDESSLGDYYLINKKTETD